MSSSSKLKAGEGDWICGDPKCGNVNFARRMKCNKCGLSKNDPNLKASVIRKTGVEIGKEAAERSHGLFSADDWSCKTCGNINWARRGNCNLCHAPRFSKEEARTGLGGGYFERDNVEYVSRGDSDDEYDEFGRKKKQFRASTRHGESKDRGKRKDRYREKDSDDEDRMKKRGYHDNDKKERHSPHQEKRRTDDDEDDEDDADVSKYQLAEEEDDDDADSAKYRLDPESSGGEDHDSTKQEPVSNKSGPNKRPSEGGYTGDRGNRADRSEHEINSDGRWQRAKRKRRSSSSSSR